MSEVSTYATGYPCFSGGGMALADLSANRFRKNTSGSIEVIPKSPAYVIGERVLRPMIDKIYDLTLFAFRCMKSGGSALDALLTRVVNFMPVASAAEISQKSTYERCLEQPVNSLVKVTSAAVQNNNPALIDAWNEATKRMVENCIEEQLHDQIKKESLKEEEYHAKQVRILSDELHKCKQDNPGYNCYKYLDRSQVPKLKRVRRTEQGGKVYYEWKPTPGFLCWSIYVDGYRDSFYSSGGYNCDVANNRPTVKEEKEDL
jgi:hypothetical protein